MKRAVESEILKMRARKPVNTAFPLFAYLCLTVLDSLC